MPSLTGVRDAAVALLQTVFPELPRVEAFSGELTLDVAAEKGLPPGVSVLVAAIAADNDAQPGTLDFDVVGTFGVLVVSNNIAGAELAEADALAVAEKVALTVHGATFGLPLSPALVKRIETATDGELAASGLSVWAVLWQQSLLFE
ncbi:MAG: phage protein Gp37 [Bilophila sp.]